MTHTFSPGDRFLWPAGNGRRVRTGVTTSWLRPRPGGARGRWAVTLDPIPDVETASGTWLYPEEMFPVNTPAAVLAGHVAAVQERRFGESIPLVELTRSMADAVTLVREALHRAFPETVTRCAVCATRVPAGAVECQDCAGGEDAAAKRAADV